jgi:DNA polymerase III epsilon subunit-like protein
MHIKIVDYNTSELIKIQALNLIIERVYNNYFNERSKYKGEFLDLTPDLQIDSQLGTVYSSCPYDIFSLVDEIFFISNEIKLFVVFDISKQVEFWNGELEKKQELFFGLFYNRKCSSFILNHKFHKLLIPKLTEYFKFFETIDHASDDYIPEHFNIFEDISETKLKLAELEYDTTSRKTNLWNLMITGFSAYWRYDEDWSDIEYAMQQLKWFYPCYDYENNRGYKNIDVFSEDFELNHVQIKHLENRIKNEYEYTIVIDTETNGLPDNYNDTWPYLSYPNPIQISWSIYDEDNNLVEFRDYIIKQTMPISRESTLIHGINDEIAQKKGVNITTVLEELIDSLEYCGEIVGHNLEFDIKVLEKAFFISENENNRDCCYGFFEKMKLNQFCTMKESMSYFNFNKYPKLSELYTYIFKNQPVGLHNSRKDIEFTHSIFSWLRASGLNRISK